MVVGRHVETGTLSDFSQPVVEVVLHKFKRFFRVASAAILTAQIQIGASIKLGRQLG